jgi:predicted Zn-dependent protease
VEPLENNVSPTHPVAELATLLAAIGLVGLALAATAWLAVEGAVRWLPAPLEERACGDLFGARLGAGADPRAAALDALLRRLARHGPASRYALRVGLVESPEPNAFALPGGNVAVTTGLLASAAAENELAFVLAHELGHVAGRDPLRALGRGALVSLVLAALGGSEGGALAGSAAAFGERAFSRAQESAADRFALARVAAEYGHVAGADEFLRRLPDAGAAGAAARAAGWLSTHPRSADRVAELRALAGRQGYALEGRLTPLPEALASR